MPAATGVAAAGAPLPPRSNGCCSSASIDGRSWGLRRRHERITSSRWALRSGGKAIWVDSLVMACIFCTRFLRCEKGVAPWTIW